MSEVCCRKIMNGYHHHECGKPAKFEVDGKWYCGIHNPNKAPTKAQIASKEKYEARLKRNRVHAASKELLEALINLERVAGQASLHDDPVRVSARAAIAKATGEQE